MAINKDKILYKSKPALWYYVLMLSFPFFFFLTSDWRTIVFEPWQVSIETYLISTLVLLLCFGVPILMLLFRREFSLYADRIEVSIPLIRKNSIYYFSDLAYWRVTDFYILKAGRQINLILKFGNQKLTFNKIELTNFDGIVQQLNNCYYDKKYKD